MAQQGTSRLHPIASGLNGVGGGRCFSLPSLTLQRGSKAADAYGSHPELVRMVWRAADIAGRGKMARCTVCRRMPCIRFVVCLVVCVF